MKPLQILWEGNFSGTLSLAQVNVELVRRLAAVATVSIVPRTTDGTISAAGVPADLVAHVGRRLPHVDVHLTHGIPVIAQRPPTAHWAWMQPWEYGAALPLDWLPALRDEADLVLGNSDHVRETFIAAGVPADRVATARLGIDPILFDPAATVPRPLPSRKSFRFLYVGGLTHRKGIDLLLAAYRRAFTSDDDVTLVIKPVDPDGLYRDRLYPDFDEETGRHGPEIVVLPTDLPKEDLPAIYAACNAFVHPYRGEGFCLPLAEAMAMGLLVICTDRGGASDFCRQDTAWLLPSDTVYFPHRRLDRRPVSNYPHWQEADLDALTRAMRRAVAETSERQTTARRGQLLVREQFTWDRAASDLHARLCALAAAPQRERHGAMMLPPHPLAERNASLLTGLGDTLLDAGDHEGAGRLFHRALRDLLPHLDAACDRSLAAARALAGLARIAIAARIAENGYLFAQQAARYAPDDDKILALLAEMAAQTGRTREAEAVRPPIERVPMTGGYAPPSSQA